MPARYAAPELVTFATALLERAGLEADKARVVAEILVEGDLLGHATHGLHLLAPYLNELEKGTMTKSGEPHILQKLLPEFQHLHTSFNIPELSATILLKDS